MAKRELIDKEEVKDVLGDTINSEGDYRHALRLLDGLSAMTEQDIVKPVLDKIRAEIEQLRLHKAQFLTNDNKVCIDSQEVLNILDKYRAESEE